MKCFQFKVNIKQKMGLTEFKAYTGVIEDWDLKDNELNSGQGGSAWAVFDVEALNEEEATKLLLKDEKFKEGYEIMEISDITEEHFRRLRVDHLEKAKRKEDQ